MKIALVIDTLVGGGAERVVRSLASGLARRRQRVAVYCLKSAGGPVGELEALGVQVRQAHSRGPDPLLYARLAWWLHADHIEVVHAHSSAAALASLPAAKLLGIPLVHTRHSFPRGVASLYQDWARRLARYVDRITLVAEPLRAALPPGRIAQSATCTPNGIDERAVPAAEARRALQELCRRPLRRPVVLTVANVRPEKDTCGLLAAFAEVRRQHPEATLVHVGGIAAPTYWAQVQADLARLGLAQCVVFAGYCAHAPRVMAGADVFCLASRTEAMPMAVLEAMSQSVPIVATAVGGVGRLDPDAEPGEFLLRQGRTALLAPPGDPEALATALTQALGDRPAAQARAAHALEDYQRFFTADQMVVRYEEVYAQCRAPRRWAAAPRPIAPRPARVLMLGPAPPQIGGMVTSIGLLMKSPLRERHELHRLGVTVGAQTATQFGAPAARADHRPRAGTIGQRESLPYRMTRVLRHVAALWNLAATLVRRRITVLHIHTCSYFTFYRNLFDLAAAKLLRRAVILHVRGNRFDRFCAGAGRCGRWLIRHGLESADAVILLSHSWHRALRPYLGRARVFVVPNAFDPDVLGRPAASTVGRQTTRFLFLAAVTEAKGVGDLIEAVRLLGREATPFEVIIAGPAPAAERRRWEERVRDLGLQRYVQFVGPVTGAAKARLLASADCFVHPSHSEGLPNSVLEAGAAGLPVIATAVGAVPEVFSAPDPRTGRARTAPLAPLVPPHDPASLAREMRRLAADPELRRQIGRALHDDFTANYSLARLAERIAAVYERVLMRRPPPDQAPYAAATATDGEPASAGRRGPANLRSAGIGT